MSLLTLAQEAGSQGIQEMIHKLSIFGHVLSIPYLMRNITTGFK